jgi:hypothetical protein
VLAAALAGCATRWANDTPASAPAMSDQEVERLQSFSSKASRHFPAYVEALGKFASQRPADWAEGERMLDLVDQVMDRPLDAAVPLLRRDFHAPDPQKREAARKGLARRGEIYRHWLDLHPAEDEIQAAERLNRATREEERDAARRELTGARRARYGRWIRTRESMIALGEDAAALLMDAFLQMLPRATADEQLIIRQELIACGPRVVPLVVAVLDLPPREGAQPMRAQCLIVLVTFLVEPEAAEKASAALQRYAKSEHLLTRKMVAEALRQTYQHKRCDPPRSILEPMLRDDPSWEGRAAAAQALGEIGAPGAAPALLDVLENCTLPSEEDRTSLFKFVAGALGLLRSEAAVVPLIRLLDQTRNADLRRNVNLALNKITGQFFPTTAGWRAWLQNAAPK